ncbi:MAG: class F sortase [Patescibacteria group bacterium]|mgnify:CR=1 FL=1
MKIKISLKRQFLFVSAFGIIFFLIFTLSFYFFSSFSYAKTVSKQVENIASSKQLNFGFPIRLRIPRIKVNALVEHVGLTPLGAMDAPKGPMGVGWLDLGPRPGEEGNAVLNGHSGYKNNVPAVFDNLYKLRKGDLLYIEDDKGVTIRFVVREIRKYDPNADATNVFSSSDGLSHLNLITCTGSWNKKTKTHSERLIVFTDRE